MDASDRLLVWDDMLLFGFDLRPEDFDSLRARHIELIPPAESQSAWGESGTAGAMRVRTRDGAPLILSDRLAQITALFDYFGRRDPRPPPAMHPPRGSLGARGAVFVIDDTVMSEAAVREHIVLTRPVARLELHRGAAAAGPYGLRAWDGLVLVRTRVRR